MQFVGREVRSKGTVVPDVNADTDVVGDDTPEPPRAMMANLVHLDLCSFSVMLPAARKRECRLWESYLAR